MSAVNIGDMFRDGIDLSGQSPEAVGELLEKSNKARTEGEGRYALTMPLTPMTKEEADKLPPRSLMREAYDFYRTPRRTGTSPPRWRR